MGIVQGLTEFLPVSSTGHLVIVEDLLGVSQDDFGLGFDAAMHLGTLAAVLIYFRVLLLSLLGGWLESVRSMRWDVSPESRLAWLLLLGTLPAGVAGVLIEGTAEDAFRSSALVGLMLILFCIPMVVAERVSSGRRRMSNTEPRDAAFIGLAQAVALIPGVSRSGITIAAGMTSGFPRQDAASFAFLLSAPIIAAAGGKQIVDLVREGNGASLSGELGIYAVGLVSAGIVGFGAIAFLMRYLRVNSLNIFVAYRLGLGALVLALWAL